MKPPIFAALDLAEALAAAKAENKILVVDASAEWCGPCKHMDATTWVDPKVVDGLKPFAIVIQVDVDAKPEDAAKLRIEAMPTLVVFSPEGVELERLSGAMGSSDLLAWLEGLAKGETSLERLRKEAAEKPNDLEVRASFARRLAEARDFDAATAEYAWVWKNMLALDPEAVGVRYSFFAGELKRLVDAFPPARQVFTELRDASVPRVGALDENGVGDFVTLNQVLGDTAATLAWFDANGTELPSEGDVKRMVHVTVMPLLVAEGRWADLGRLYEDPLRELRESATMRDQIMNDEQVLKNPELLAEVKQFTDARLAEVAKTVVRALRAADRLDDAKAVEEQARSLGVPAA